MRHHGRVQCSLSSPLYAELLNSLSSRHQIFECRQVAWEITGFAVMTMLSWLCIAGKGSPCWVPIIMDVFTLVPKNLLFEEQPQFTIIQTTNFSTDSDTQGHYRFRGNDEVVLLQYVWRSFRSNGGITKEVYPVVITPPTKSCFNSTFLTSTTFVIDYKRVFTAKVSALNEKCFA